MYMYKFEPDIDTKYMIEALHFTKSSYFDLLLHDCVPVRTSILLVAFHNFGRSCGKYSCRKLYTGFLTQAFFTRVSTRTAVDLVAVWYRTTGVVRGALPFTIRTNNSIC